MLYCYGDGCPLRGDCYRHTQPTPGRDRFGASPYDALTQQCEQFVTNIPDEDFVRESAYHIWLRRGRPEGCAAEHWREAYEQACRSMGRDLSA